MSGDGLGLLAALVLVLLGMLLGRRLGDGGVDPADLVQRAKERFQRERAEARRRAELEAAKERAELEYRRRSDSLDERVDALLDDARRLRGGGPGAGPGGQRDVERREG